MLIQRVKSIAALCAAVFLGFCSVSTQAQTTQPPATADSNGVPITWVDEDTGHKITRLTTEPDSKSLYAGQNAFTPDGHKMVYLANNSLYVVELTRFHKTHLLLQGPINSIIVGRKTPTAYFTKSGDQGFYSVNINTGQSLKILDLPPHARITTLNADETMAAGTLLEGEINGPEQLDSDPSLRSAPLTEEQMDSRLAARVPMALITLDLRTAAIKPILHSTDWLDEVSFSPTDPTLLMYYHQGPWLKVNRLWTIRADGTHNELVHKRTLSREVVGNAFWDADGKTIWYDLQTPLGLDFYLANYNVTTGQRMRYPIERNNWSIHYDAAARDGFFCGDGSDSLGPAIALDGKWLELFYPRKVVPSLEPVEQNLIKVGGFVQKHMVNLSKQKYAVEPNARFTPNHAMVIFTSNMLGPSYVFAVDTVHYVAPAEKASEDKVVPKDINPEP
jgi:oligogalacturonide lyase